jgi:hypothetical protein
MSQPRAAWLVDGLTPEAHASRRVDGMDLDLGHDLASTALFRKAASPTSDTSTHFGLGEDSAS